MNQELQNTLTDVRKAYRLIYLYQKNVMATIERFRQEFPCSFYWWTPTKHSPPPQRGSDLSNRWMWDLLPFYSVAFLYLFNEADNSQQKPGDWMLSLDLSTDSEFCNNHVEPNPIDFEKAENTETYLLISFWYCVQAGDKNWFYGIWDSVDCASQDFQTLESPQGMVIVQKKFTFDELEDEQLIVKAANEFKALIKSYINVELQLESNLTNL